MCLILAQIHSSVYVVQGQLELSSIYIIRQLYAAHALYFPAKIKFDRLFHLTRLLCTNRLWSLVAKLVTSPLLQRNKIYVGNHRGHAAWVLLSKNSLECIIIVASVTRLDDFLYFGQLLKPLETINWPNSSTFLGNFCKGVKIYHFSGEIIFGQLL